MQICIINNFISSFCLIAVKETSTTRWGSQGRTAISEVPKMDKKPHQNNERASTPSDEVIPVMRAGHLVPVARSQVRWVEAQGDYVRLHTAKHSYLWRHSLTSLEQDWDRHGFARIHRSRLVFIPLVTKLRRNYSGWAVTLGSGPDAVDLQVSRRKVQKFKQHWIPRTSP